MPDCESLWSFGKTPWPFLAQTGGDANVPAHLEFLCLVPQSSAGEGSLSPGTWGECRKRPGFVLEYKYLSFNRDKKT